MGRTWSRGLRILAAWCGLALWLACGGGGNSEGSSSSSSSSQSTTITVRPGFTPDPETRTGTTRAVFEANRHGPDCRGYIGAVSDFWLRVDQPMSNLRVLVNAPTGDATLVIRMADGSYRCNDDAEGLNPIIQGAFPSGTHHVYVGAVQRNASLAYTIGVTENATLTASSLGGGGAPAPNTGIGAAPTPTPTAVPAGSNFGTVSLAPGFTPDPQTSRGTAGGPIAANTWNPTCRGNVSARPDHELVLSAAMPRLRVLVKSERDTTLVVQGPDGQYRCVDDAEGLNPIVEGPYAAGTHRIWVGTFSSDATGVPYVIGFTEFSHVTAASLQ